MAHLRAVLRAGEARPNAVDLSDAAPTGRFFSTKRGKPPPPGAVVTPAALPLTQSALSLLEKESAQISELRKHILTLNTDKNNLKAELESAVANIKKLQEELGAQKDRAKESADISELRKHILTLNTDKNDLKAELESAVAKNKKLQEELGAQKRRAKESGEYNRQINDKLDRLKKSRNNAFNAYPAFEQAIGVNNETPETMLTFINAYLDLQEKALALEQW
jgi:chromosome segregation ATPase